MTQKTKKPVSPRVYKAHIKQVTADLQKLREQIYAAVVDEHGRHTRRGDDPVTVTAGFLYGLHMDLWCIGSSIHSGPNPVITAFRAELEKAAQGRTLEITPADFESDDLGIEDAT